MLDASGKRFTLANYTSVLSTVLSRRPDQQPQHRGGGLACCAVLVGVPFAFCLARLPIGGKPVLLALAAMPLVLPSFVSAYALVLLLGRSGIVTGALQSLGIPFGSIYGAKGIVLVYTLTLYPYVLLPYLPRSRRSTSRSRRPRRISAPRARRMLRTVTLPLVLPAILAGGLLVFIETLENFGVPFVLAEDMPILAVEAFKLFVGETAPIRPRPACSACC